MRRSAAVLAVLGLLVVSTLGSVAIAQSDQSGEYSLEELQEGGQHPSDAPPSVRLLGTTGAVAIQHTPPSLVGSSGRPPFLERGSRVEADELTVYSTRFGESISERDVVVKVAFWRREMRNASKNESERQVATDVEVVSSRVSLAVGYDKTTISIPSHYDDPMQATMWLETPSGEPIEGARWRFTHESNPATKAPTSPVDSRGDLWKWGMFNILMVAVPGVLVSTSGARYMLRRTGAGPMYGVTAYGLGSVIGLGFVAVVFYFAAAEILSRIPQLLGVAVAIVAFFAILETAGRPDKWVKFKKNVLTDARTASGEETTDSIYRQEVEHRAVRREDGRLGLVKPGIFPFLARYFARPAAIPVEDLKTKVEIDGKWSAEYVVDPGEDVDLLEMWRPARFETDWRIVGGALVAGLVAPSILAAVASKYGVGLPWGVGIGLPILAVGLGAVFGIEAIDGEVDFTPAPVHFRRSLDTLAHAQAEYEDATELDSAKKQVWQERVETRKKIDDRIEKYDGTLVEEMLGDDVERRVSNGETDSVGPDPSSEDVPDQEAGDDA